MLVGRARTVLSMRFFFLRVESWILLNFRICTIAITYFPDQGERNFQRPERVLKNLIEESTNYLPAELIHN